MLLIDCPWCGPRDETEYHYGGQAHVAYPEDPHAPERRGVGRVPVLPRQPQGPLRRTLGAQRRLPPAGSTSCATPSPTRSRPSTPARPSPRPDRQARRRAGGNPMSTRSPTGSPPGGRIDRSDRADASPSTAASYTGHPGDTLASALLATAGSRSAPSLYRGRPRGILAAGVEEPNALVKVARPGPRGRVDAAGHHRGAGRRAGAPTTCPASASSTRADDAAVYDKKYVHTDVLVVGAGPAGLAAAREAARHRRPRDPGRRPARARRLAAVRAAARPSTACPAQEWVARTVRRAARRPPRSPYLHPHHRVRQLRRQLRASPSSAAPTTSAGPSRARRLPRSGSGTSAPSRWCWPPAPTSVRWSSRTTTAPASCWPRPSAPT